MRSLLAAAFLALAGGAAAQEQFPVGTSVPQAQILTIDSSRLLPGTVLGQSLLAGLAEEREAFAAESERIAAEFRAEELDLTAKRGTLPREEFAELAEAFDVRVQAARVERDEGEAALAARSESQEILFLREVRPILGQIMEEAGAVVLLEADTVLLRNGAIDVTALAITRINEATRSVTPREAPQQPPAEETPEE
ncbi:MAG: OmpH family outer membrane protein [Rhodobacteraceae bacterium]|nr:OmpH family outer membrane protein [Paracoccaceae bacterium]